MRIDFAFYILHILSVEQGAYVFIETNLHSMGQLISFSRSCSISIELHLKLKLNRNQKKKEQNLNKNWTEVEGKLGTDNEITELSSAIFNFDSISDQFPFNFYSISVQISFNWIWMEIEQDRKKKQMSWPNVPLRPNMMNIHFLLGTSNIKGRSPQVYVNENKGSSINHVVKILGIFDPPPPSWPLLLNKAYVIKWSFG